MKRMLALLLAFSMLFSLTLPAYAEEVVEEIAEEITEEVVEEVLEEVTEESEEPEEVEESAEEITEEVAEEIVEEVVAAVSSDDVAGSVAEVVNNDPTADMPNPDDPCAGCADGTTVENCRNGHWGMYGLWMHQINGPAFLSDVNLFAGRDSITVKLVYGNFHTQRPVYEPSDNPPPVQAVEAVDSLTFDREALQITAEFEPAQGMDMFQFTITPLKAGDHTILYPDPHYEGGFLVATIHALGENDVIFMARQTNGNRFFNSQTPIEMMENKTGSNTFFLQTIDGEIEIHPSNLYATSELINIDYYSNTGNQAFMTLNRSANGLICYRHTDGRVFAINARAMAEVYPNMDTSPEVFTTDEYGNDAQYELKLSVGKTVKRQFRLGSTGASIPAKYFGAMINGNPMEMVNDGCIEFTSSDGLYTITAKQPGSATFFVEGRNYEITVTEAVVGDEMLFFEMGWDPSGNTVKTYIDMPTHNQRSIPIFFGTPENKISVPADKVELRGDVLTMDNPPYHDVNTGITYYNFYSSDKTGYAQFVYHADNGLEYVMPIKVFEGNYDSSNTMVRSYMELPSGVTAGIGNLINGETLQWTSQFGRYYNQDDDPANDNTFDYTIGLLVMENGSPVDISELQDVRYQVLSCSDNNNANNWNEVVFTDEVSVGTVFTHSAPAANLSTKAVRVRGSMNTTFAATVAVSYTFRGQRFTQQVWCFQTANGDVVINASDLDTAGKMNVVLSSWDALSKWAKEKHGKTLIVGNFVELKLPDVDYDSVIVAQAQSPFKQNTNSNPISSVRLTGMDQRGNRASMVGLIEKCCITAIGGIDFVAQKNATMTTTEDGNKKFTCGILADYRNTYRPVYDDEYLDLYCGGETPSLELQYLEEYINRGRIFDTCIDVGVVQNCNFVGFDYGVRSTLYGHIGSQMANTYSDCHYGIYINNDGHAVEDGDRGGDTGNTSNVNYSRLIFRNNVYAVRIESLPDDVIPYDARVHDCNFIDNFREFWIDENGTFYFYRNYFAGKWQENDNHHGDWTEYKDVLPSFDERDAFIEHYYIISEHRPGRVHFDKGDPSKAETLVIINPCRSTSDFEEKIYWFYGGEDQLTVIEQGNEMLLSADAVEQLKEDADVSVVNSSGETIITYTFQGKGEDQT